MRGHTRLLLGGANVAALCAVALLSLVWTPDDPTRMHITARLKPPLSAGLAGADALGRDVFSMLMIGARNSLDHRLRCRSPSEAGSARCSDSRRRPRTPAFLDGVIMRACDALFALPSVLSAILLGALVGHRRHSPRCWPSASSWSRSLPE